MCDLRLSCGEFFSNILKLFSYVSHLNFFCLNNFFSDTFFFDNVFQGSFNKSISCLLVKLTSQKTSKFPTCLRSIGSFFVIVIVIFVACRRCFNVLRAIVFFLFLVMVTVVIHGRLISKVSHSQLCQNSIVELGSNFRQILKRHVFQFGFRILQTVQSIVVSACRVRSVAARTACVIFLSFDACSFDWRYADML